ncbi:MAG TPA: HAD-IC family P-type ATPase, partial [Luteitalea sp.]|nr:HAD-IC family P-type ATPase [Luteitalea sp.]
MTTAPPHAEALDVLIARLGTNATRGLAVVRADEVLAATGPNALTATPTPAPWRRFLAQFRDVLVLLLLAATVVSTVLWFVERDAPLPFEALAILAVVLLNATMGYVQEARAEAAVAALRAMSSPRATVVRDGERRTVPAADVVPGDVIIVAEGDTVPADARLLESAALQAAEAALTGESVPVAKEVVTLPTDLPVGDRRNMVFSGTSITYGHGRAVVTATGMQTEMGHVARLLEQTPEETTPLQQELDRTGRWLGVVVMVMAVVMIVTIVIVERVREIGLLFDVLLLGVALAVAAVPEGLPAVVTAVLSMGVQRMAQRHAIVRHLAAVETLGSATVIASDKTGTLTQNEMTVRVVETATGRVAFDGIGYEPFGSLRAEGTDTITGALRQELDWALAVGALANNATLRRAHDRWTVQGDPTEGALLVAASRAGWRDGVLAGRLPRIGEVPFSSARKLMSTVHHDAEQGHATVVLVKGAPDVILARCTSEWVGNTTRPLTDERRAAIAASGEALAGEALRTLGVASRLAGTSGDAGDDLEHGLTFAGLIGIIDPPRAEARNAVARARRAGVRPI